MHSCLFVLTWLACISHGRRVQVSDELSGKPRDPQEEVGTTNTLQSLVELEQTSNQVSAKGKFGPWTSLATRLRHRVPAMQLDEKQPGYPIGVEGTPWNAEQKAEWLATRNIVRSYQSEVIDKIDGLKERFDVRQYGALSHDPEKYPLFAVMSRGWTADKPSVLVTGGVHGYETSGVQGAIRFLETVAETFSNTFNILVVPCVSPWGYETIQRWNAQAVDPNRSFNPDGEVVPGRPFNPEEATDESSALISLLQSLEVEQWICHIDLHETTDTDESEFRPAKAARDGEEYKPGTIPDGFYLVADETNPQGAWHTAMIDAVREVTHIAPPDDDGLIIGEKVIQAGVIAVPKPSSIGLCSGVTNAIYATTTEVYPDSPTANDDQCNRAQVACIVAGLKYIIEAEKLTVPTLPQPVE